MKDEATDRFLGDTILICHLTKWFAVLHHAMDDPRPVFSGNTIVRVFWPWSPLATYRRRAGVRGSTVSEHLLDLERQYARRSKEEGENW